MSTPRLLAHAQLFRLPNVFTAFADILLGTVAFGALPGKPLPTALMLGASGCLYLAGMALNDFFDRAEDARTRPSRPIPSGRIQPTAAWVYGFLLLLAGAILAWFANSHAGTDLELLRPVNGIPVTLAVLITLYDSVFKYYWIGPIAMGACRFLNVLMACLLLPLPEGWEWVPWHLAAIVGVYIIGVTWFARSEEGQSQRRQLIAASGIILLAVGLAVLVPMHFEAGVTFAGYPYLLVLFLFIIGRPIIGAIKSPSSRNVQLAVKRCIFGLVVLDAILATAFVGWPGLAIILLLLPAIWLGRWIYST